MMWPRPVTVRLVLVGDDVVIGDPLKNQAGAVVAMALEGGSSGWVTASVVAGYVEGEPLFL